MEIKTTEIKCDFVIIIIKKSSDVANKMTVPFKFDIIKTKSSPQVKRQSLTPILYMAM